MPSQSRSARQLPRKRGSQNETFRLLPPTRAGEVARRAGEGNNKQCGGRFLRTSPRRGTLSFVTQKFFCFGAINNRRNYWWGISFLSSHEKGGAFEPTGFDTCQFLISIPVWCCRYCYKYSFD